MSFAYMTVIMSTGYGERRVVVRIGDASEATGISGALQELADESWGMALSWLIGLGSIFSALFTLVEAWFRRSA
jgi:hypothetical protein